jgi:hypothetical protein
MVVEDVSSMAICGVLAEQLVSKGNLDLRAISRDE